MQDVEIALSHVSKKYCKSLRRSMRYGISDITRNTCRMSSHSNVLRNEEFWALKDVSFEVRQGESLGLIGANGSGKSTVLKLINGIFWPDIGKVAVRGKVGALIEVGAGFHPTLTGRENVYLNGAILGMTKAEVNEKFDDIVEFAEIGDFLDTPVKHYSSGMFVKLGFAVAAHCDPDVLLVDEVLAVGDISFRRKCFKRLKELSDKNVTRIIVSHDVGTIQATTDRVVLLDRGETAYVGSPEDAISEYLYSLSLKKGTASSTAAHVAISPDLGPQAPDFEVDRVVLLDKNGHEREVFATGEPLAVRIEFTAKQKIEDPMFVVAFLNSDNEICSESSSTFDGVRIDKLEGPGSVTYKTDSLPMYSGLYRLYVTVRDGSLGPIAELAHAAYVSVRGGEHVIDGAFYMQHSWDIELDEDTRGQTLRIV
jgi:lipopolysaccharide transport system ATP-binding protein